MGKPRVFGRGFVVSISIIAGGDNWYATWMSFVYFSLGGKGA
jgi:hypothetical protein